MYIMLYTSSDSILSEKPGNGWTLPAVTFPVFRKVTYDSLTYVVQKVQFLDIVVSRWVSLTKRKEIYTICYNFMVHLMLLQQFKWILHDFAQGFEFGLTIADT